jgi:hypothetical protein
VNGGTEGDSALPEAVKTRIPAKRGEGGRAGGKWGQPRVGGGGGGQTGGGRGGQVTVVKLRVLGDMMRIRARVEWCREEQGRLATEVRRLNDELMRLLEDVGMLAAAEAGPEPEHPGPWMVCPPPASPGRVPAAAVAAAAAAAACAVAAAAAAALPPPLPP